MKKIKEFLSKKRKGMTLIELMIVVIIIGIITAGAFAMAGANTEKTKRARAAEDIAAIASAVSMYVSEADDVDAALDDLANLATTKVLDAKLSKEFSSMKSPWGEQPGYTLEVDTGEKTVVIDCATTGKKDLEGQDFTRTLSFE